MSQRLVMVFDVLVQRLGVYGQARYCSAGGIVQFPLFLRIFFGRGWGLLGASCLGYFDLYVRLSAC